MEDSRKGVLLGSHSSKALIAIVSCERYINRLKSIQTTWVPQAIAAGYDVEVFTGARLGISDDYYSLPLKVKTICQWAVDNNYHHMLKTDDDSYIRVARFEVVKADYAGMWAPANDCGTRNPSPGRLEKPSGTYPYDYASGGAYWLSRRSLEIIANEPLSDDWAEDRWVGNTLATHEISLTQLPGYYGGHNGSIDSCLREDTVVVTQIAGPRECELEPFMLKCHMRYV